MSSHSYEVFLRNVVIVFTFLSKKPMKDALIIMLLLCSPYETIYRVSHTVGGKLSFQYPAVFSMVLKRPFLVEYVFYNRLHSKTLNSPDNFIISN